jgi:hypothetical protein
LESAGNEVEALGGFAAGGALALRYEKYNYDEDLRSFLDLLLARLTDPKKELVSDAVISLLSRPELTSAAYDVDRREL